MQIQEPINRLLTDLLFKEKNIVLPLFALKFLTQITAASKTAFPADVFLVRHAILFNEHAAGTRDESPKNVCVGG